MSSDAGWPVQVFVYDLTRGMAKMMSPAIIGKQIDGIWHSGLHVYGWEYFFGGGIVHGEPARTMAGIPTRVHTIGYTEIDQETFHDYLMAVAERFSPSSYSLLKHNCNNFADEAAQFLCEIGVPDYIVSLPREALSGTPAAEKIRGMINMFEAQMKGGQGGPGGFAIPGMNMNAVTPVLPIIGSQARPLPPNCPAPSAPLTSNVISGNQSSQSSQPQPTPSQQPAQQLASPPTGPLQDRVEDEPEMKVDKPPHAHDDLALKITNTMKPWSVPMETSAKGYVVALRVANKRVDAKIALTEQAFKYLDDMSTDLEKGNNPTKLCMMILDNLINTWPAAQLYAVVALIGCIAKLYAKKMVIIDTLLEKVGLGEKDTPSPLTVRLMSAITAARVLSYPHSTVTEHIVQAGIKCLQSDQHCLQLVGSQLVYNAGLRLPEATADDNALAIMCAVNDLENVKSMKANTRTNVARALAAILYRNSEAIVLAQSLNLESSLQKLTQQSSAEFNDLNLLLSSCQT